MKNTNQQKNKHKTEHDGSQGEENWLIATSFYKVVRPGVLNFTDGSTQIGLLHRGTY